MNALSSEELYGVFLDCRPQLKAFLRRLLRCTDTAADLVQEIYLRLTRLGAMPDETAARACLFRVASNLASDYERMAQRRAEILYEVFGTDGEAPWTHTPERMLLAQEQAQALRDALAELPPLCANVLYLSRMHGLTHGEIAERLNVSKSLVEKYVVRALNHCRRALE